MRSSWLWAATVWRSSDSTAEIRESGSTSLVSFAAVMRACRVSSVLGVSTRPSVFHLSARRNLGHPRLKPRAANQASAT